MKKASKPQAKSEKSSDKKKLTPLEKARLARASGKASPAKKAKRVLPTWKIPEDFKPHFLEVMVKTDKDGLLSNTIKATRYIGNYNPDAEDKKKEDLGSYDPVTLQGILGRLSMTTYATNAAKRLPANTVFKLLMRVKKTAEKKDGKKTKNEVLSVGFKTMWKGVLHEKSGRIKPQELDKKDPDYRKIRKSAAILPAAFKNVLAPPKRVRGKRVKEEAEE